MKNWRQFLVTAIHLLVIRPIVILFLGLVTEGREQLRQLRQYIMIANHNSHLDIFLLYTLLPTPHLHRTRPLAAKDYFQRWPLVFRMIGFLFNPIWVDRSQQGGGQALQEMAKALEQGDNLIMFPEGTRGSAGELQDFRKGLGVLAAQFQGLPLVPILLQGPERILPRKTFIPVPFWINAQVGPPQQYQEGTAAEITSEMESIMSHMLKSASRSRHRRRHRREEKLLTLAFLGIDGSGKSTLSRLLAAHMSAECRTALVSDALVLYSRGKIEQLQPLLLESVRSRIGQYAKVTRSMKQYKLPKITELLLRDHLLSQISRWYDPGCICLDGAPLLNITAWISLYRPEYFDVSVCEQIIQILTGQLPLTRNSKLARELPDLQLLERLHLNQLTLPELIFWVDTPPAVAIDRIQSRGEPLQSHEDLNKLTHLRQGYELVVQVLKKMETCQVHILDGNLDLKTLVEYCQTLTSSFQED